MATDRQAVLTVEGTRGRLVASNPVSPQRGNLLTIESAAGRTASPVEAGVSYDHMVRAYIDHVVHGLPFPTQGDDAIANMAAIDAIYRAAGLPIRGWSGGAMTGG
jgi:predicted dehydrogenase